MKVCVRCGEEKPTTEFYANSKNKDGFLSYCKECHKAYQAKDQMVKRYGVTTKEYGKMFEAQGGVCAICRKPETTAINGKPKKLGVDHDHRCCQGQKRCGRCNRGLLCQRCNAGIGHLGDDPAILAAAIEYLQFWEQVATVAA